jgi:hypothetical protein
MDPGAEHALALDSTKLILTLQFNPPNHHVSLSSAQGAIFRLNRFGRIDR